MPLTPFHLGPGLLLGILLIDYLDFPTFVIANIIVDWRAALVYIGLWAGPRHGWMHTYLGVLFFSPFLIYGTYKLRVELHAVMDTIQLSQETSLTKITASAVIGMAISVTIDSFHHPFMEPFMPFQYNPLLGIFSTYEMRLFTFTLFVLSIILLTLHLSRLDYSIS